MITLHQIPSVVSDSVSRFGYSLSQTESPGRSAFLLVFCSNWALFPTNAQAAFPDFDRPVRDDAPYSLEVLLFPQLPSRERR